MPQPSTSPPARSHAPGADQLVKSLVTEFAEEKRKERELELRRRGPMRRYMAPAVAAVACLAAWVMPVPQAAETLPPPPAQYTNASARMTLVLAARRLESFRSQYRRLPTTLDDAGIAEPRMGYQQAAGDTYVLKLPVDNSFLTFDSGMAPAAFLEDALSIIRKTAR
jgi:hypothetical protein